MQLKRHCQSKEFGLLQGWGSVDVNKFKLIINSKNTFTLKDIIQRVSYNALLAGCPLYDTENLTFKQSHQLFQKAMPTGFAWEALQVLSGKSTQNFPLGIQSVELFRIYAIPAIPYICTNETIYVPWLTC